MVQKYNAPPGTPSSIDLAPANQLNSGFYHEKKAIIALAKEQFFGQLASVTNMPKYYGKTIKRNVYLPLLDSANINDQGLDAAGAVISTATYAVSIPHEIVTTTNATKAAVAAALNDNTSSTVFTAGADDSGGAGKANITLTSGELVFNVSTVTKANLIVAKNIGASIEQRSGNLYGSSKDVGSISGKMPLLGETGGLVNRVGFKRKEIEGSMEKMGFYDDYTQESMDFDSDPEKQSHITREMTRGANEMNEDFLQIDLLNAAGVVKYAGVATTKIGMVATDLVSYSDLMHLSIDLDNNRTPKHTTVIKGSRMVDTVTIPGARIAYIGSELLPTLKAMKDLHNNPAWIPMQKYADAGTTVVGEEGAIDNFRFVVVPEMMKWAGAGGDASADSVSYKTGNRFDVFPILVVGDESFTTIGFQTDGNSVKFVIKNSLPGSPESYALDRYGETGFMSIKWYYGFMALRPERIGMILTVAKL